MNSNAPNDWAAANQRSLVAALENVRCALQRRAEKSEPNAPEMESTHSTEPDSALAKLCAVFGLSPFERDLLLLCAGVDLEAGFASLCAAAQGEPRRAYPTFSLALAALPGAHWSAIIPAAPLRRWRLLELGAGDSLTTSPLRIDERILHYLTGVSYLDDRLQGLFATLPEAGEELPPSHRAIVEKVCETYFRPASTDALPVVQLCGETETAKRSIAAAACAHFGSQLYSLGANEIPSAPAEREALTRLWEREVILERRALLIDCAEVDNAHLLHAFLERLRGLTFLSGREPIRAGRRVIVYLEVEKPSAAEQSALWREALGAKAQALDGKLHSLVAHFNLGPGEIHAANAQLEPEAAEENLAWNLWDACRVQSRQRLEGLAQRLEPMAAWDDLVLPEPQRQILREIAAHVRQRATVYEQWGFAAKGARGLGISALFAGASGTGKTMAAEVLAAELRLDLYRIDLSSVVSKYIGETEKNLRRLFDAAEQGGAILFFDEADALFGKRSEVKDSHDRYANIEVSYLLQRMEAYRGLAILTTNMKQALDPAFLRRIRFVVQFPFPDAAERTEIWRRIFPRETPTENLELEKLARLDVAGGNIRNVALNAAFLAADAGEPVRMRHLLRAARSEYAKLEKPLTEAEIGGWQ